MKSRLSKGQPFSHGASLVVSRPSLSEKEQLEKDIQEKKEWMAANQFGLPPAERAKKWDEIRELESKLRRL